MLTHSPLLKAARPARMLVYVLASDTGLAPNVQGGICTLAVCKPQIRRHAQVGDWLIGMSTRKHGAARLIYAARIGEKLPYAAYAADARFIEKKPTARNPAGDNFFSPDHAGSLALDTPFAAHYGKPDKIQRDLNAPLTLVSQHFWYFGKNAPELPDCFHGTRLVQGCRRGHRVIEDSLLLQAFSGWLQQYALGIHGTPRDAP